MRHYTCNLLTIFLGLALITSVYAGPREEARRMHDRLAGVPAPASVLDDMEADIVAGNYDAAATRAMDHDGFYDVTLKNFATPWTNKDQDVFAPLNDYTATIIGMVRDNVPFNTVLSADLVYVAASGLGLPAYSMTDNAHYEALESAGHPLQAALVSTTQSAVTDLPAAATAGVMTTRAGAQAFFYAGTNRAMVRFTLMNHLCNDLEQLKDSTRPPDRIRQDVSRSPGGDSRIFLNNCVSCHSGMDPLAQAFAYYEWDQTAERVVYTDGQVQGKNLINAENFQPGFALGDDAWVNYWREGPNAWLGWDELLPGSGNGAKSLGTELANSEMFARCQVKKVFETVCLREPANATDRSQIEQMTTDFRSGGYLLKETFADAAAYCSGD